MKERLFLLLCSLFVFISCATQPTTDEYAAEMDLYDYPPISEEELVLLPDYSVIVELSSGVVDLDEAKTIYEITKQKCNKYNLDVTTMLAIWSEESDYYQYAISHAGEKAGKGIGQVSYLGRLDYNRVNGTLYTQDDLFDLETNIEIACWIYSYNVHYGVPNSTESLLAAYNLGWKEYLRQKALVDAGQLKWKGKIREYKYVNEVKSKTDILKDV